MIAPGERNACAFLPQKSFAMPRIAVDDIELEVRDQGQGRPLLLVHGFPLDHSMWDATISDLARDFRVIAPDLRGFGKSGVSQGTVTMDRFAHDLNQLLDGLEIPEPVTICGLSMGGYIAFRFHHHYARRAAALILCDTRAAPDTPQAADARRDTAEKVLAEGVGPLVETMLPKLFAPASLQENGRGVQATRAVMLATAPQGVAAALRGMADRQDSTPALANIESPALVIVGEHDAITLPQEMRSVAEALPHAAFVEIPQAGHMTPVENPAAVNAAIRGFLGA